MSTSIWAQQRLFIGGAILVFVLLILPPYVHRTLLAYLPLILGFVLTTFAIDHDYFEDEDHALRRGAIGAVILIGIYLLVNAVLAVIDWHPFDFGGLIGSLIGIMILIGLPTILGVVGAISWTPHPQALIYGGYGAVGLFTVIVLTSWLNLPVFPVFALLIPLLTATLTVRDFLRWESDLPRDNIFQAGIIAGTVCGVVNCLFGVILFRFLLCLGVDACTDHFGVLDLLASDVVFALLLGVQVIIAGIGAGIGVVLFKNEAE